MTAPVPLAEQIEFIRTGIYALDEAGHDVEMMRAVLATLQQHERAMAEREIAFQQRDQMEAGSFHMLERIVKAETALRLVIAQAGIPDPGDACRAIIKTARAALDDAATPAGKGETDAL